MPEVFLVMHHHPLPGDLSNPKLIGVFSTRERALAAVEQASHQPGFADLSSITEDLYGEGGFVINCIELDETSWKEGYVTA